MIKSIGYVTWLQGLLFSLLLLIFEYYLMFSYCNTLQGILY